VTPFANTVAVVTGAASGIGRATADRLAREEATVALVDIQTNELQGAVDELSSSGAKVRAFVADVSDPGAVETLFADIEDTLGLPTALFNIAGIFAEDPFPSADLATFARIFEVNVRGTWLTCQAFVRRLILAGSPGAVVNISSVDALYAEPRAPAYCASKGAIYSFTRALAFDHGIDGVRANCICPGLICTPMTADVFTEDVQRRLGAQHPVGRLGQPEDVAAAALFLASDDASFITGQGLVVDGGFYSGRDIWNSNR
jgi:NAD(P)-dependent dehydrogenase (short-subunit alcohol dehydrogenase family)